MLQEINGAQALGIIQRGLPPKDGDVPHMHIRVDIPVERGVHRMTAFGKEGRD